MNRIIQRIKQRRLQKKILNGWLSGAIPDQQLTAEQRTYVQHTMRHRMFRLKARFRRRVQFHMFLRNITVKPIGRLLKPLPVNWHPDFGDGIEYPHCPACDELAYQKDHCVFCGRRFSRWDTTTESGK